MKAMIKKVLCAVMVTVMLASVLCIGASAENVLEDGSRYTAYIDAGTSVLATYVPHTSGRHFIESIGDQDTYVILYDASYNKIAEDDDDGDGSNFFLCANLEAGRTYYYEIFFYSQYTYGTLDFDFFGPAQTNYTNTSYEISLLEGVNAWYQVTPTKTTMYCFESVGDQAPEIVLYNSGMTEIARDTYSGYDDNFKLPVLLKAGQTYYYRVSFIDNSHSGTLNLNIYECVDSLEANISVTNTIDAGTSLWYSFTPDRTKCYTISSLGSHDTDVTLYSNAGKFVASDDDTGEDYNFLLSRRLTAGRTYYFEVRYYSPLDSGELTFNFIEEQYPDVSATEWYYDAVSYVSYYGFMTGYQNGSFGPADNLQRQDFVVSLARIFNADLTPYSNANGNLSDVVPGSYYAPAVAWAVDNGIITGYQNGEFGVGDRITREQVCTILHRTFGAPAVSDVESTLGAYPDDENVSAFATNAMAWAIQNGVISGMQNGSLSPTAGASRAQIATILMRMDQNGMFAC